MSDLRVKINLDAMTLGDYANITRGRLTEMLGRCVTVQGYQSVRDAPITALKQITDALTANIAKLSVDEMLSPVAASDIHITNVDQMLIGDLEAMETGNGLLEVFGKFIRIDGYEDMAQVPFKALGLIRDSLSDAISKQSDPNV